MLYALCQFYEVVACIASVARKPVHHDSLASAGAQAVCKTFTAQMNKAAHNSFYPIYVWR